MEVGIRELRAGGTSRKRLHRLAVSIAALLCVSSAAAAHDDQKQSLTTSTAIAPAGTAPDAPLADEFEPFAGPRPDLRIPDHAVDLDELDVPVENPVLQDLGSGVASFYGRRFHGRRTASGERFDMNAMTAAHKTLPFGTNVRVTNPRNGKSVVVRINDRGPFSRTRDIDLSRAAATELGIINHGHADVELDVVAP